MSRTTRTFRIFVSSTFSDQKEERNALQKYVFPRLRELCMQHRCRFQAIDLRWGVRDEAGLDQQTMRICLDEIARSQRTSPRPNFIVLLGDRYGWRPLPDEIPDAEFAQIRARISTPDNRDLLTTWYQCDLNAVPPVHCLQPRLAEFADFNTWEEQVERPLRRAMIEAIAGIPLAELGQDQRTKYRASATEQEIAAGALSISDATDHVFCYFRTIRNLPHDHSAVDFVDLDNNRPDTDAAAQLKDLKDRLEAQLPGNIQQYTADWTNLSARDFEATNQRCERAVTTLSQEVARLTEGASVPQLSGEVWERLGQLRNQALLEGVATDLPDLAAHAIESPITLDHIARLCADVYLALTRVILDEIARLEQVEPLNKEINNHDAFGKERANSFVGRAALLQTIADYVAGSDRHPLAVSGESGSGKSALLARAVQQVCAQHSGGEPIVRYIGATPESSDGRALLESICRQVTRAYGANETNIPTDYKELVKELAERLALATAGKPLFLFLDALDQLSDAAQARNLIWLPHELPLHVRLIVSTLPGECLTALERKLPSANIVRVERMPSEEGSELLNVWLSNAARTLQPLQRNEVLRRFATSAQPEGESLGDEGGMPLYLKLAFEEARRWKSYTEGSTLSADIPGVIRDLFARLSSDSNHGRVMVERSLGYLAAARNGLSEDEILDILSRDEDVRRDFTDRAKHAPPEERLPVVVWSRLYFELEPYLTERSSDGASLMSFYHRQLREVVEKTFLAGDEKGARHSGLAEYFARQDLFEKTTKVPNIRKLSELPYQQTYGRKWDELHATLTDFEFLEAKCTHVAVNTSGKGETMRTIYGGVYELQEDYRRALESMPAD